MSARNDTSSGVKVLPVLVGLIALCLGCAAALTLLTHDAAPAAAPAELSLLVQRIPYEAQNALRGEPSAFDALAKSAARLKVLRSGGTAGANWSKLGEGVTTVGAARSAVETIQA